MVKLLFFDTETTGVPQGFSEHWNNFSTCRLVQLSWIVVEADQTSYKILSANSCYISSTKQLDADTYAKFPDGFKNTCIDVGNGLHACDNYRSSEEAIAVHHITEDVRNTQGVNCYEALCRIYCDMVQCEGIVSHSIPFDIGTLANEFGLRFINFHDMLKTKTLFDTKHSELYVKHRSENKTGNLVTTLQSMCNLNVEELGQKYGQQSCSVHDALFDTILCFELFKRTKDKNRMRRSTGDIIRWLLQL